MLPTPCFNGLLLDFQQPTDSNLRSDYDYPILNSTSITFTFPFHLGTLLSFLSTQNFRNFSIYSKVPFFLLAVPAVNMGRLFTHSIFCCDCTLCGIKLDTLNPHDLDDEIYAEVRFCMLPRMAMNT